MLSGLCSSLFPHEKKSPILDFFSCLAMQSLMHTFKCLAKCILKHVYLATSQVYTVCVLFLCAASSVDFLISDGEEESSFLTLPNSVLQRRRLTSDPSDPGLSDQQLLIQVTISTLES